jgi:hypothetical protein
VVQLGPDFWRDLSTRGVAEQKLAPKDEQILQICAAMPRRIPSESQARHALDVLRRLTDDGMVSS